MKNLMMLYGVTLGKRFTKRQKAYFMAEINETYPKLGFPIQFQDVKQRFFTMRNVIAGNLNAADIVFVAAYDTPSKSFLPNYKYYPFHTEKNLNMEYFNLIAQIIIAIVSAFMSYACLKLFFNNNGLSRIPYIILTIFFAILALYETKAHPNVFNFNRNSASLAVMERIARECKGDSNIAFVFLDQAVSSFEGLKLLKERCNVQNKKFILLDCIASGEKILVAHRENTENSAKKLIEKAKKYKLEIKNKVYSDEKAEKNVLAFAKNMLYIVSGTIEKNEFIVKNTKSKKDIVVDINRLDEIAKLLIEFVQNK